MNVWTALLDVLIILTAAIVLGGVFERFKQNAILGYLLERNGIQPMTNGFVNVKTRGAKVRRPLPVDVLGMVASATSTPSPKYLQDWGGLQGTVGDSRGIETAR
jgi:hypothetical protein